LAFNFFFFFFFTSSNRENLTISISLSMMTFGSITTFKSILQSLPILAIELIKKHYQWYRDVESLK